MWEYKFIPLSGYAGVGDRVVGRLVGASVGPFVGAPVGYRVGCTVRFTEELTLGFAKSVMGTARDTASAARAKTMVSHQSSFAWWFMAAARRIFWSLSC